MPEPYAAIPMASADAPVNIGPLISVPPMALVPMLSDLPPGAGTTALADPGAARAALLITLSASKVESGYFTT